MLIAPNRVMEFFQVADVCVPFIPHVIHGERILLRGYLLLSARSEKRERIKINPLRDALLLDARENKRKHRYGFKSIDYTPLFIPTRMCVCEIYRFPLIKLRTNEPRLLSCGKLSALLENPAVK